MNFFDDKTLKKILYTFVAVLLVAIIAFVAIFIWYDNKLTAQSEQYSLAEESDYETVIIPSEDTKEASSTQDKNIANVINNEKESNKTNENTVSTSTKNTSNVENKSVDSSNNKETTNTKEENVTKVEKKVLKFEAPVEGEISKDFANETLIYSKTLDEWTTHLGIDIKGEKTSVVKAAESGTVESIKNDPRYGLTVTITHIDGFKTVYSNLLTAEFVTEGKNVEKGDTIGTIGESASFEILDNPHLHFEMYKDETPVNPTIYLK